MEIIPQYNPPPTQPLSIPGHATDFTDFYRGRGIYSVIHAFHHNRFFQLDHHLARSARSLRLLGLLGRDCQLDEQRIRRADKGCKGSTFLSLTM